MTEPARVLELGSGVSASYAAKLLGDYGADVIKVEMPDGDETRRRGPFPSENGDPEQSGLFLALNVNKRGVCIDLDAESGRSELRELVNWADILVHNYSRVRAREIGLDPDTLKRERPQLVVLSITPFGITGPYRDFLAHDITLTNAGGWANACPMTHTDPDLPPLKAFGQHCGLMAAISAAMVALATHRDAKRSGVGDYIDFSEQAYVTSVLEGSIPSYAYYEELRKRYQPRGGSPWKTFKTKDGHVFVVCIEESQWERFVECMGNPDWTQLEVFADKASRQQNQDVLYQLLQEFMAEWNAVDLYHAAQKYRVPIAPVFRFEQIGVNEHLRERDFFVATNDPLIGPVEYMGATVLSTSGRSPLRSLAPRLGEHNAEIRADLHKFLSKADANVRGKKDVRRPLEGIRVVDLGSVWAGPFGAMNLAHLGAEVIRLESETRPDLYRRGRNPPIGMTESGINHSGMFNQWSQGKKSVAVNFRHPLGPEIVKSFVAESDVVIQNFATGVMDRLGLGYDVLKEVNPGIILASISGYGQTGPYRDYAAYGPCLVAVSGMSSVTGYIGGGPEEFGVSIPDPTAGATAALAVVAALERRERTGLGDHLDVSLWEATQVLAVEAWMEYALNGNQPDRIGNRDPWMAPHGCFACCGEDSWVSIACSDDSAWLKLAELINPGLSKDERFLTLSSRKANEDALETIVKAWAIDQDRWDVTWELQSIGVSAFPTYNAKDILEDRHLNERGTIERLEHPQVGRRSHVGIPWRVKNRPNGVRAPAPCLGADTDTLLAEVLGYDARKIADLHNSGVLR